MTIDTLINKSDNFEVVRNQIAQILANETAAQVVLAAGEPDPSLWEFDVLVERNNPISRYQDGSNITPIVNVWFDSDSFDKSSSNTSSRQTADGRFNVDVYTRGIAAADGAGHKPGDAEAQLANNRIVRLVRNILMADIYARLDLPPATVGVGLRWIDSISTFQPQQDNQQMQQIAASRVVLGVKFNELSPQQTGDGVIEQINSTLTLDPSGAVIALEYDFTP